MGQHYGRNGSTSRRSVSLDGPLNDRDDIMVTVPTPSSATPGRGRLRRYEPAGFREKPTTERLVIMLAAKLLFVTRSIWGCGVMTVSSR